MKILKILVVTFLVLALVNGSFAQKTKSKKIKTKASKILTITNADNGKTFTLKKLQSFKIVFAKECSGCSYIWHLTEELAATDIIKITKDYNTNPSCKNCEGGEHDRVIEFKAVAAGNKTLSFDYFKEHFNVDIIVQ